MWCAERTNRRDGRARGQESGHAVNSRRLERFIQRHGRENARQAAREHRLACSRRTDHQNVVSAGSSHFQRPLRRGLTPNIGEVRPVRGRRMPG
jgi:hypothetical protein